MTLCLLLHVCIAGAFLMNIIRTEPVIISYSLIAGMICISFESSMVNDNPGIRRYFREILVDGETTVALTLRSIINSLFFAHAPYSN